MLQKFQECPESMDLQRLDDLEAEERRIAGIIFAETIANRFTDAQEIATRLGFVLTPAKE